MAKTIDMTRGTVRAGAPLGGKNPLQRALILLSNRVHYDAAHQCYRLDGRPASMQEILKAAQQPR